MSLDPTKQYFTKYTDSRLGSGFTGENSAKTVTEAIEESAKMYIYSGVSSNINQFVSPIEAIESNESKEAAVIFHNTGSTDITITIPTTYKTVNAMEVILTIPSEGFGMVNCLVLNSMIFITTFANDSNNSLEYTEDKEFVIASSISDLDARLSTLEGIAN